MIIVVATVRIHPGKAEAYEAACHALMPKVRAANSGILFYHAGKSRDETDTYRVVEAYEDQAAMDKHMASDLLQQSFAGLQELIADIDIRLHDRIE